jgi:PAS domain S-box-containing protein
MNDADEINRRIQGLRDKFDGQITADEIDKMPGFISVPFDLLNELFAHQIFLEKKNEELERVRIAHDQSRKHFADLYDFAPVGYVTLDDEGIITEINRTAIKLLHMERKDIVGKDFGQLIADDRKDLWLRHFLRAKQNTWKQGCELPFSLRNGSTVYYHVDSLYMIDGGMPPQMRITLSDVTQRKNAETEQRIAAAAFETQAGIIVTDPHKVILRVNQAFSRITGYSAEEAIGKTPSFLQSGLYDEMFYHAIWDSIAHSGFWQGEIWDKRKNGEIFPLLQTITAVTDGNGQISHFVGSFTDITIQKQVENVLREARQNLEKQVTATKEDLEKNKLETTEIKTALNVLLKQYEMGKAVSQISFADEVDATVLPFIKKLKAAGGDRLQTLRLTNILEANIQQLMNSYGQNANLAAAYKKLTRVETQVASMIRQGMPTKVIAAALNVTTATINVHRKHIRKKLGLENVKINLYTHMQSLTD